MTFRLLTRRWLLLALAASALVGAVCAEVNSSGNLVEATAATHVLVDDPGVSIVDRTALPQDVTSLQDRAELYARLVTTTPVLDAIARRAGVPAGQLSGSVDLTGNLPVQLTQAGSEQHANELRASRAPYRLELQADPVQPVLAIYAEAPSVDAAQRLAQGAVTGLRDYLANLAVQQGVPTSAVPVLRQLEPAVGDVANSGARVEIAGLTFITTFALTLVSLLAVRQWRRRRVGLAVPRRNPRSRLTGRAAADWPRTTRVLPWSIVVLMTLVWLTPFDRIQLSASLPINITLDRIVLPLVVLVWLIAFRAGPGAAPRIRITRVHVAIAAFLACAFLSVVLDAHYLNHANELTLAIKKAPLLVTYFLVFAIVASSVRRSEVPALLTYTLALAVICGIGVIVEYRLHTNLFVSLSSKLFKGPFELVGNTSAPLVDSQGRPWIEGPAVSGLEVVAMLSMAMPIGILGILQSKTRQRQIVYTLATAVIVAAMFATDRKSALVAPCAVLLALAYFRRREMLTLAPLVLIIVLMIPLVAPGVLHTVLNQFTQAGASSVPTVDSRTANYDAVRPDLWSHLLLGRGQGTYAPPTDRIIDSEILLRLIETGVLGLVTFLLIPISVIVVARRTVAKRHPRWSGAALCGVAAAVGFIVESALYSVMVTPHAPDVFFYMVGLAVAVVAAPEIGSAARPEERTRAMRDQLMPSRRPVGGRERAIRAG